jgi:hypothetical protein
MKKTLTMLVGLSIFAGGAAWASTASQREYARGYADCSAGRYDEYQHGVSYKAGCDAAAAKTNDGGLAPAASSPVTEQEVDAYIDASVPGKDRLACVRAVKKKTQNPKVVVIGAIGSEANNQVTLGVGPQRAPWKCLVKRGRVAEVSSLTDEGAL